MLSEKQKVAKFKLKARENFEASLALEGVIVNKEVGRNKVADLKAKYAR